MLGLSAVVALMSMQYQPAPNPSDGITRVAGDGEVALRETSKGVLYSSGQHPDMVLTDTALPVGYPRPTPPGAIEIKRVPSVRRAEVSGSGAMGNSGSAGFWPLFMHISRNDIAMTAPVEMELAEDQVNPSWTMAFLYERPENGPAGTAGVVEVVDTEELTVLALGVRGRLPMGNPQEQLRTLESWLEGQTSWRRAGQTRVLGYNGPNIRAANRWWEVQIPIERADVETSEQPRAIAP